MFLLCAFHSERSLWKCPKKLLLHLVVLLHYPNFQRFIFFHPRLLSGAVLYNWLSRNILQGGKINPAHAAICSQFSAKTDASFDIYDWKETKKNKKNTTGLIGWSQKLLGCRVTGQNGVFVSFVTSQRASGPNYTFSSFLNFPKGWKRLSSKGWTKTFIFLESIDGLNFAKKILPSLPYHKT